MLSVSVYQVPYIIAIMQQGVEIRTIEPRLLIQSIDLPKLKLICIGRYVVYIRCYSYLTVQLFVNISSENISIVFYVS